MAHSCTPLPASSAYADERSSGDVQYIFFVEKTERTPLLLLNKSGIPAIMNHVKYLEVSSQHYKERDGETAYSLFNVNAAAA